MSILLFTVSQGRKREEEEKKNNADRQMVGISTFQLDRLLDPHVPTALVQVSQPGLTLHTRHVKTQVGR